MDYKNFMDYKDISTSHNYPKTLVIRNTPDGMIWQIYHVKTVRSAEILAKGAESGGFQGITLEDYQPEMEETFPDWRNNESTQVELRLIEGDNKLEYLMRRELITVEEVMEYAQKHMDGVDQYDDEQLNKS